MQTSRSAQETRLGVSGTGRLAPNGLRTVYTSASRPFCSKTAAFQPARRGFALVSRRGNNGRDVSCEAHSAIPPAQGLFDPANDKDACGVGFVANLSKGASRACVTDALKMLARMSHRGACGCEENTGICASAAGRCQGT
eukprot:GHRR01034932.1.p1 GENE.GHRR01034932.1~~GHRR01034932.1.p1  ORF type:complete len:140 (-),score=7.00 GHRR01034932.1:318-737(-)